LLAAASSGAGAAGAAGVDLAAFHEVFEVLVVEDAVDGFFYDAFEDHDFYAFGFHDFCWGVAGSVDQECPAVAEGVGECFPAVLAAA